MRKNKPTLDDYVDAIIDKDSGVSYPNVLVIYDISPAQFYIAVINVLDDFMSLMREEDYRRAILLSISKDKERTNELFNMGEECVQMQYDRIRGKIPNEKQNSFYYGTFKNRTNVEEIIYYAFTSDNPNLKSLKREDVVREIMELPIKLVDYLRNLGLRGLMSGAFGKGEQSSPLAIIKSFDNAYQRKTNDVSLFDLNQESHLHKWQIGGHAPLSYWKNKYNIEEAIYHTLTENHPKLASDSREEIIIWIKELPSNLQNHLEDLGMAGLMTSGFEKPKKNSPSAVLEIFDKVYQDRTGDVSLFDLTQKYHLHKWGDEFMAPNSYWKDQKNVEEAIYHTLTENHPQLASDSRVDVIDTIKGLPRDLFTHFYRIGLGGLIASAFGESKISSPLLMVLELFDDIYQQKTGNSSLFDLTQKYHLHKWGDEFMAPKNYWRNKDNIEEAIYHTLTENHPQLASNERESIVLGIRGLPTNLQKHFENLGLCGLMCHGFEKPKKNSPLAVLEVFDSVYRDRTGDASLFDLTQKYHLHKWGESVKASQKFWANKKNRIDAVYHTLVEEHPRLESNNRKEVMEVIRSFQKNLQAYFKDLGLSGAMQTENQGRSTGLVLKCFDKAYQQKTGNPSIFDKTQDDYFEFESRGRLVRE